MNKGTLRKKYKSLRKELSPKKHNQYSDAISNHLFSNFQLEGKIISLFLPIEKQYEINTYKILEKAMSIGAQVTVPVADFENTTLKHILYTENSLLATNAYGIPEPNEGKEIPPSSMDYVFVPLLAVDKNGNRIGYGKGFYDRFLSQCRPDCKLIGLHLFDLEPNISDISPTDVRLNYVITPDGIINFG